MRIKELWHQVISILRAKGENFDGLAKSPDLEIGQLAEWHPKSIIRPMKTSKNKWRGLFSLIFEAIWSKTMKEESVLGWKKTADWRF